MAERTIPFLVQALAAVALLLAAFYNGFPIVYSDTSTYLASGFELETPPDRPITYGLFMRLASLNGLSLWLVVFFQSLLLVHLIYKLFRALNLHRPQVYTLVAVLCCAIGTGVSWTSSQLIADVFTPMVVLLWAILLLDAQASLKTRFAYGFLFLLASSMHMSHLMMSIALCCFALLLRLWPGFRQVIQWRMVLIILALSGLSFLAYSSSFSKFRHVFFVAKLDESGILQQILRDKCADQDLRLCAYRDSLPHDAVKFLWDENSPLKKLGGFKEVKGEFRQISSIATGQAKYLRPLIASACRDSWRQLFRNGIADGNGAFGEGTLLDERVGKYVPGELGAYRASEQQAGLLLGMPNTNGFLEYSMLLVCLGLVLVLLVRRYDLPVYVFGMIVAVGIISNAIVCGSLSTVSDRYGCRVVWLLALYLVLLLVSGTRKRKTNEDA